MANLDLPSLTQEKEELLKVTDTDRESQKGGSGGRKKQPYIDTG